MKSLQEKFMTEKHELETNINRKIAEAEDYRRQLASQKDMFTELQQQKKAQEIASEDLKAQVEVMNTKMDRLDDQRKHALEELASTEERLNHEKKLKEEALKAKRKQEAEYKQLLDQFELLQNSHKDSESDCKR